MNEVVKEKLETLIKGFIPVLYQEDDPDYVSGKFAPNIEGRERYRYWEWTQGVGLFGLWKLFEKTKDERYLKMLTSYYDERIAFGLPGKNVNTMAPKREVPLRRQGVDRLAIRRRPSKDSGRRLPAQDLR